MPITVRAAGVADLSALLALYAELHPSDPPLAADVAQRIWAGIEAQRGRTVLVAELGDVVPGTLDCTILPNLTRGGRPFMLIENVVVAGAYRRQGVGAALMASAATMAQASGCYKMQLLSRADRADAHRFYEACGFTPAAQGYRRYFD